jgi:ribonuclease HI
MVKKDHKAVYIHCDGSMLRDPMSSGGTGYVIKFPDELELEDVSGLRGVYQGANIERIEIQGIIEGMKGFIDWFKYNTINLSVISKIIVLTDRLSLCDEELSSPFKIQDWRKNGGKNFEGKEIKNWDLLNQLDKTRTKLRNLTWKTVRIEYIRRKYNREADKLTKKAQAIGLPTREIAIEGHKIGRREFNGEEVKYSCFAPKDITTVHIFRKRPIREQWEINAEICSEKMKGQKLIIITDHLLQEKLQRGNIYEIKIKKVFSHHFEIYKTINKLKKGQLTYESISMKN